MYKKFGKRVIDIILSLIAIIVLSPIYIIISVLVLIFMGWPILFKQPRPGKDEKIFNMYKFRTMTNKKDKDGNLLPDDQRLNKFGRILRKTSLDEIPELFCILTGKMSFIGPRPLLVEYLPYYTDEERHRHDVSPGLTGWAQVNGRNLLGWNERFKKDVEYVNNINFILDLKIIFMTIKKVIFSEDIAVGNEQRFKRLDEERNLENNYFRLTKKSLVEHKLDIKKLLLQLDTINNNNVDDKINDIEKYLNNGTATIYVYCNDNNRVVGFIWCYKKSYKKSHINYFIVDKDYRGSGIGGKLIEILLKEKNTYELRVNKENNKAVNFYLKHGFKNVEYDARDYVMIKEK